MPQTRHAARSRSPERLEKRSKHRSRSPRQKSHVQKQPLPFNAHSISRHDLFSHRPMFALYLDIQKQLDVDDLDENELKGRWKSFVGKWNRGELAEGWYDPKTLEKAKDSAIKSTQVDSISKKGQTSEDEYDNEEDYGPTPALSPNAVAGSYNNHGNISQPRRAVASTPTVQDLRARDEQYREDHDQYLTEEHTSLRNARALDRREQNSQLNDLIPRADPGTRERQLEKKCEQADANRSFAASKEAGGDVDLRDAEVMGDEDSLGDLKRMKQENQRKKNEREIRREEILRARQAEREVKLAGLKEKEDRTMQMFKEIARARFGGGGDGGGHSTG